MNDQAPPPLDLSIAVLAGAIQLRACRAVTVDLLMNLLTVAHLEDCAAGVRATAEAARQDGGGPPEPGAPLEEAYRPAILDAAADLYAEAAQKRRAREAGSPKARFELN